ncbi:MAG: hypothetical protein B6229_08585 [Spirochaetaceae bacterium 4572_7]|nr:MAG: hypothetical protein B6229_08585 [Spirochaetaceae bacterium 4572_7]
MEKILLLDNYDSFTYNLLHLIKKVYTGDVIVKRDRQIDIKEIEQYRAIIISPGPGRPETTPMAMEIIRKYHKTKPILGICLGMQCINDFFGGNTINAPYPIHGKTSKLKHNSAGLLKNIPQDIDIARYHSLIIKPATNIEVTGICDKNLPMSIKHKNYPIFGLQFHPESFLTQYGKEMINNFLELIIDYE